MSAQSTTGPFCGALGCTKEADVVIDHPRHGPRTVCFGCAEGYEVMWDV